MKYLLNLTIFSLYIFFPFYSIAIEQKEPDLFTLSHAKEKLQEFISIKTESNNIKLSDLKISRVGSGKFFTIEQALAAKIADKFKIISLDISGDKFSAELQQQKNKYTLSVSGVVNRTVKIPVLSQNIGKETVITQEMLEFKQISESKLKSSMVTSISDVLGTVAGKNLIKNRPFDFKDIKKPVIVRKNDIIQAVFLHKNMEVKLLAVAQSDGAEGDIIRLKNYDSGRFFEGRINSQGQAIIAPEEQAVNVN